MDTNIPVITKNATNRASATNITEQTMETQRQKPIARPSSSSTAVSMVNKITGTSTKLWFCIIHARTTVREYKVNNSTTFFLSDNRRLYTVARKEIPTINTAAIHRRAPITGGIRSKRLNRTRPKSSKIS
jgi:hypothetical protein